MVNVFCIGGVYYSLFLFLINYTNTLNAVDLGYYFSTHGILQITVHTASILFVSTNEHSRGRNTLDKQ